LSVFTDVNGTKKCLVSEWCKNATTDIRRKINHSFDAVRINKLETKSRLRFDAERSIHRGLIVAACFQKFKGRAHEENQAVNVKTRGQCSLFLQPSVAYVVWVC